MTERFVVYFIQNNNQCTYTGFTVFSDNEVRQAVTPKVEKDSKIRK